MGDGDPASNALARLRAAEQRALRADVRAEQARRELAQALDAAARESFAREVDVHERAAATHRRAAEFQREHLLHAMGQQR
jgi:hypothetical protein